MTSSINTSTFPYKKVRLNNSIYFVNKSKEIQLIYFNTVSIPKIKEKGEYLSSFPFDYHLVGKNFE